MTQLPDPHLVKVVHGRRDEVVLVDREEALRLREAQLTSLPLDRPLIVDLSVFRIITFSAADELIAKWLVLARSERREQPVVVAFFSNNRVIQETLEAVLKSRDLAAYGLSESADPSREDPDVIGVLTKLQEDTLQVVKGAGVQGRTAGELARELGLAETNATYRLNELAGKGLLIRGARVNLKSRGRPGAVFQYPYRTRTAAPVRQGQTARPAPA